MKVTVRADLCQGHGLCYGEAPEIFLDDEFGHARPVKEILLDEAEQEHARAAALMCPEHAIVLSD